jgi:site-specific DNA-methyltransferase (adenine-specific)
LITDGVIVKLDVARAALAEAKTLQETKQIIDVAAAAEIYARRQHLGQEAIGYAHSIKIEALRLLGEMLRQTPRATGGQPYQSSTCSDMEQVAPTLPSLGIERKTSMIAQRLADLPPEQFQAVRDGHSTITKAIREVEHARRPAVPLSTPGRYRVIYADPPWRYNDTRGGLESYRSSAAEDHYPTMSLADICAVDVKKISEDDAVLFCWATFPLLPDALEVVEAWGFTYKTAFVWNKVRPNFGNYHNANGELLLLGTRGSCRPDTDKREPQVITLERTGRHSEKPEEFRVMIERLYARGKRIELFARSVHDGWDAHGNEVPEAA